MTNLDGDIEHLVRAERERLRQAPAWEAQAAQALGAAKRTAIRTLRLAAGVAMLWGAYLAAMWGWPAVDKPFAALTLRDLGALVGGVSLACILFPSAFSIAFGERVKPAPRTIDETARSNVMAKLRATAHEAAIAQAAQAQESERLAAERVQLARWYSRGKWIGMLFDPAIARKHPWLPFAAIVVAYACIVLFAVGVPFLVNRLAP